MGMNVNNIVAANKNLALVLQSSRYKLDYFQREYKWARGHIGQLIDDLDSNFYICYQAGQTTEDIETYRSYYMGPIILYKGKERGSPFHIIDGQQRLTSLTLLLIYLNHLQGTLLTADSKVAIDEFIYSKPLGVFGYNIDVPNRIPIIEQLFKTGTYTEGELKDDSCYNLAERYEDIAELFPPRLAHPEVLPLFIFWVIRKLVFVEILADSDDNAYVIFETMNDRGLKLTSSEMLKSHLLSHIKDNETKIKELDDLWKMQILELNNFGNDTDDEFFKAWLRAKYAVTMRKTERDAENEDFEKIGTRFHNWVKDYGKVKMSLVQNEDYYFIVKSDFRFYSDVYIKLLEFGVNNEFEHPLYLQSPKRIADSLTFPFLLSPILIIDTEDIIDEKILMVSKFLDAFVVLRLLNDKTVTQAAVKNYFNGLILTVRNKSIDDLKNLISKEYKTLLSDYKADLRDYISYNRSFAQYILARIKKYYNPEISLSSLIYRRKSEHYVLFPILNDYDVQTGVPFKVMDIIKSSLVNYCLVPQTLVAKLNNLNLSDRISLIIKNGLLIDNTILSSDKNILNFFIQRNAKMKEMILEIWKV